MSTRVKVYTCAGTAATAEQVLLRGVPYLTLPHLTLPYLTLPYLTLQFVARSSGSTHQPARDATAESQRKGRPVAARRLSALVEAVAGEVVACGVFGITEYPRNDLKGALILAEVLSQHGPLCPWSHRVSPPPAGPCSCAASCARATEAAAAW